MRRENIQNVLKNANVNLIDQEIIAKLYKSVSIKKSVLKICRVTPTKDTHQIPKN